MQITGSSNNEQLQLIQQHTWLKLLELWLLDDDLFWPKNLEEIPLPSELGIEMLPLSMMQGLTFGFHAATMVRLQSAGDMGPVARAVYEAYLARRDDLCPCDEVASILKFIKAVRYDDDRRSASEEEGEVSR